MSNQFENSETQELKSRIAKLEWENQRLAQALQLANDQLADLTAKTALINQPQAIARQEFLAQTGKLLNSSLDYEVTLQNIAQMCVPFLADWCSIDLVDRNKVVKRVATAHVNPSKGELGHSLLERFPYPESKPHPLRQLLLSGKSQLIHQIKDNDLQMIARSPEHLQILRTLNLKSGMNVPLIVREQAIGAFTLVISESDRRYTPADLALAEELAQRAALAIDNARLYSEAQEAIKRRDEFLTIAAHELRTPLAIMRSGLQLITKAILKAKNGNSLDLNKIEELAGAAVAYSRQMERLIDDMAEASDAAEKNLKLALQPLMLNEIIEKAVKEQNYLAKRHEIILDLPSENLVKVAGDKFKLPKALGNLIENGIKFNPDGGTVKVQVRSDLATNQALITISDNGPGIPLEKRQRLFQPYFQGESSYRSRRFGGLGLGLFVTKAIIEGHGGNIGLVDSEKGSTFAITLPLVFNK